MRHVHLPYLSEFEIINVVFQEIGHGSHHTGLSRPGRSIQQVTPLPSPPRSLIKGFVIPERRQVRNNFLLQARVHRERVECRRMLVRDRIPQAPRAAHHEMVVPTFLVGENLDLACLARIRIRAFRQVVQVLGYQSGFVPLSELQVEYLEVGFSEARMLASGGAPVFRRLRMRPPNCHTLQFCKKLHDDEARGKHTLQTETYAELI